MRERCAAASRSPVRSEKAIAFLGWLSKLTTHKVVGANAGARALHPALGYRPFGKEAIASTSIPIQEGSTEIMLIMPTQKDSTGMGSCYTYTRGSRVSIHKRIMQGWGLPCLYKRVKDIHVQEEIEGDNQLCLYKRVKIIHIQEGLEGITNYLYTRGYSNTLFTLLVPREEGMAQTPSKAHCYLYTTALVKPWKRDFTALSLYKRFYLSIVPESECRSPFGLDAIALYKTL